MKQLIKPLIRKFIRLNYILIYSILYYYINYFFEHYLNHIFISDYSFLIHIFLNSIFITFGIQIYNGTKETLKNNNKPK